MLSNISFQMLEMCLIHCLLCVVEAHHHFQIYNFYHLYFQSLMNTLKLFYSPHILDI